jgi:hypothetical protein
MGKHFFRQAEEQQAVMRASCIYRALTILEMMKTMLAEFLTYLSSSFFVFVFCCCIFSYLICVDIINFIL